MQKLEKTIVEFLEDEFRAKARTSETSIKINVQSINSTSLFRLSRIITNSHLALEIKRSGTGVVIIVSV